MPGATAAEADAASTGEVTHVACNGLTGQHLAIRGGQVKTLCPVDGPHRVSDWYSIAAEEIGRGSFGVCLAGSHRVSGLDFCVKVVERKKTMDDFKNSDIAHLMIEMSVDGHPNVARFLDYLVGPSWCYSIMELLRGKELFDCIIDCAPLSIRFCRGVMRQVLSGVGYCHRWGVIHRDIKLDNFRFRDGDDTLSGLTLLDYGLCCRSSSPGPRKVVGTLLYMAPEAAEGCCTVKSDIWSVGVMLYVLLTGCFPFEQESTQEHSPAISKAMLDHILKELDQEHLPAQAVGLLKGLMAMRPGDRLGAEEALRNVWLAAPDDPSADDSCETLRIPKSAYFTARTMSVQQSKAGNAPPRRRLAHRQLSDALRSGTTVLRNDGRPCAALTGTLAGGSGPCRIVFLDVDGVLAPRINAGQLVHQCVEGAVVLSRLAGARVVLTSAWRLIKGKAELLEALFRKHHGGDDIFDVTPDLQGEQSCLEGPPCLDREHFVRVGSREGLSLESASEALAVLGADGEHAVEALQQVFRDPKYDTHVYSELSDQYSRVTFSPRSFKGADWNDGPCSEEFAHGRCQEVRRWLQHAERLGIQVDKWVVIDDDDLLQTDALPQHRRSSNENLLLMPSTPHPPSEPYYDFQDGGDDPWQMAF